MSVLSEELPVPVDYTGGVDTTDGLDVLMRYMNAERIPYRQAKLLKCMKRSSQSIKTEYGFLLSVWVCFGSLMYNIRFIDRGGLHIWSAWLDQRDRDDIRGQILGLLAKHMPVTSKHVKAHPTLVNLIIDLSQHDVFLIRTPASAVKQLWGLHNKVSLPMKRNRPPPRKIPRTHKVQRQRSPSPPVPTFSDKDKEKIQQQLSTSKRKTQMLPSVQPPPKSQFSIEDIRERLRQDKPKKTPKKPPTREEYSFGTLDDSPESSPVRPISPEYEQPAPVEYHPRSDEGVSNISNRSWQTEPSRCGNIDFHRIDTSVREDSPPRRRNVIKDRNEGETREITTSYSERSIARNRDPRVKPQMAPTPSGIITNMEVLQKTISCWKNSLMKASIPWKTPELLDLPPPKIAPPELRSEEVEVQKRREFKISLEEIEENCAEPSPIERYISDPTYDDREVMVIPL